MDKLGDGDCTTVGIFARIGLDDKSFAKYLKDVLNLDPLSDGAAAVPVAKLCMACDICKKRSEVEIEIGAQRAANHLPPQLAIDDFPSLRLAFERAMGHTFDDHRLPSESYLERKIGELETSLKADKLVTVTSFAQEERQRTPHSVEQAIHFDSKGLPTMRTQKKDFFAPMPADEYGLRNRFEIMGALMEMLKLRNMSNAIIASASLSLMKDYVDWLCGKSVWGYVVKGSDGRPISCPSLSMVCNYDFAVRELQHRLMKNGKDFKRALEEAMADADTRTLNFTTPFSMEANTPECRALSAPGLRERFGVNPKAAPLKKPNSEVAPGEAPQQSKSARRNAAKKAKLAKALADAAAAPPPQQRPLLALDNGNRGQETRGQERRKGKGKGKDGAPELLPRGIRPRTHLNNKMVCYAHNQGRPCKQQNCPMEHVCWFCHGSDHKGPNCPNKPN